VESQYALPRTAKEVAAAERAANQAAAERAARAREEAAYARRISYSRF
jgi:hypothetical protein